MEKVGIRELKDKLSLYVRKAEAGDVILVTDRGRIVAELVPPGSAPPLSDIHPGLVAMARRGEARLPTHAADPDLYRRPLPKIDLGGQTVQDLIDWERGER
jgi:prevent-host-death family protein